MNSNIEKKSSIFKLKTPVLFIIFNRLETTKIVFEAIRKVKPNKIFIAGDGPRNERIGEKEVVQNVREYVLSSIDWDCKIYTQFFDENLGCKEAVISAIDWFFSNVHEGIILEDDCLPDPSFFLFCEELLERYREDNRIMMIGGSNFQFGQRKFKHSYYYSRYFHIWGWASWKRAWNLFDKNMTAWPEIRDNRYLLNVLSDKKMVKYWESIFNSVYYGNIDTWDYQWVFSCWIQNGLSIIPNENLVKNIGFGQLSTHTSEESIFSNISTSKMDFPLNHPKYVIRNNVADEYTEKIWYSKSHSIKSKWLLIKAKLGSL